METVNRVFKRKHDFYYLTLLVYVAFFVLYIFITGTVTDDTVQFGFRDPVVYIIAAFIVYALVMLVISMVRNQRLEITDTSIILRSRFYERTIRFSDIERVTFARDRYKPNDGTFAVLKLRLSGRRRLMRLRFANYEREKELYQLLKALTQPGKNDPAARVRHDP
ncbi:MAG: hypothetical protein M5R41_16830 [Bacteroidia bacterium]|nr:hypothetical protein [Bacteroidia bacterium]